MENTINWHTEKRKLSDLKEWDKNPRIISKEAFVKLKESIKERGFHDILKIDENNVVLSGNQRLRALKDLGYEEVECKVSDEILTEEQKNKVAIESNIQSGEWDIDSLEEDFSDTLDDLGLEDLIPSNESLTEENKLYTAKVVIPTYEPKNEKPSIEELVDTKKAQDLYDRIVESNLDPEVKSFLEIACTRFYVFNYSKIADFYANSNKEIQEMMERLALVIVDYDKAIEYGFLDFVTNILDERKTEHGE